MNYRNISANEAFILSLVEGKDLPTFDVSDIARLSEWERSRIHNTLTSLLRKGIITRVKRGRYTLIKTLAENIFRISTDFVNPSYISFWTALSHYGFTEQQVRMIQLVSTKQIGGFAVGHFQVEIVTFKSSRFFGYKRTDGFVIAEPEKVLIDSLFRPDLCGGLDEYAKCLHNAWNDLDEGKLVDYAIRFENRSLVSRLGYLIEDLALESLEIERLQKERSRSYVKLDLAGGREGVYDGRWRVIINRETEAEKMI